MAEKKKGDLHLGILHARDKDDDDEGDMAESEDGVDKDKPSLRSEAASKLGTLLGLPPEKHAELEEHLAGFHDAHEAHKDSEGVDDREGEDGAEEGLGAMHMDHGG